jgi:hypothetical protein
VVLQAALQKERATTQALLEERDRVAAEKELLAEEKTARLLEEERARNDAAHRAMYELLVVSFFCILAKSCT